MDKKELFIISIPVIVILSIGIAVVYAQTHESTIIQYYHVVFSIAVPVTISMSGENGNINANWSSTVPILFQWLQWNPSGIFTVASSAYGINGTLNTQGSGGDFPIEFQIISYTDAGIANVTITFQAFI